MFKPSVIVIDFETALVSGPASHEFYRPDFRVVSCAFSWFDRDGNVQNHFTQGEDDTRRVLKRIADQQIAVVVHNIQFEHGVMLYRFPDIKLDWHADTMRLLQVADNGGREEEPDDEELSLAAELEALEGGDKVEKKTGLSLQAGISRWLPPTFHNHKEPFYKYLRETCGVKAGKEGGHLHLLPPDLLRAYNVADTDLTLRLYDALTRKFQAEKYDWALDHSLYMHAARMIAESRGRGIKVDLEALEANLKALDADIAEIWEGFHNRFRNEISELEEEALTKYIQSRKTEKGQARARETALTNPEVYKFNLTSTKQKQQLFMDKLGIEPKYFTTKGKPAFGKQFLKQWGEGGGMLAKRGTMLITRTQIEAVLELAKGDGRWHIDLKACGTKTGRFAGGKGE